MVHIFSLITLLGYTIALTTSCILLYRESSRGRLLARFAFHAGFISHILLIIPFIRFEEFRFLRSGADYFFWLSLAVALAYQLFRQKIQYPVLGVFLLSATVLFLGSSSYLVHMAPLHAVRQDLGIVLSFHVLPAIVAEVSLCIAAGLSAVFLMQERRLKGKRLLTLQFQGPSLEWLERGSRYALALGFLAMSFAIVSGCIWAYALGTSLLRLDVSIIIALLSWCALGFIQIGKFSRRWSARQLSIATVISTVSIVVAFLFIRLLSGTVMHGNPGI